MTEHEFMLADRIAKIKSVNEQYNLLEHGYLMFSGGKDSTVVHYLLDLALPDNRIPRLFVNTGLEYKLAIKYVKEMASKDDRIQILTQDLSISETLEKHGYPFKSKEHSAKVENFNRGSKSVSLKNYLGVLLDNNAPTGLKRFKCPEKLLYQFKERGKYNYSTRCCDYLKKRLANKWAKEHPQYKMVILGLRAEEGGRRARIEGCITNNGTKFHPILVVSEEWEKWFIDRHNIRLCDLYYPPYNFSRAGCVGCPFNPKLQQDLEMLDNLLPAERDRAERIFGKVYNEYRRVGYRLKKNSGLRKVKPKEKKNENNNEKD